MPHKSTITKADVIRAGSIHNKVSKVAEALSGLDSASLGCTVSESTTIVMATKILGKIKDESQAVLDKAEELYKNRDVELINRATLRYWRIQEDTELCKISKHSVQQNFLEKTTELSKQGFSQIEIDAILTDPAPEIEVLELRIKALKTEKMRVEDFLRDVPIYSPELLVGTAVEVTAEAA
ncbi:hypothetical protein A1342_06740 [Methylomonas methanica]|uniref:hypothetical protein n=1 Tax=Methylomonas methanica TaxID=421 RepID=UPI0007C8A268|nr:hypothetical protein [Methylomonas methanica]OAH96158.1 hypothetical protein A1342_06740 [Methylomonas methanica]